MRKIEVQGSLCNFWSSLSFLTVATAPRALPPDRLRPSSPWGLPRPPAAREESQQHPEALCLLSPRSHDPVLSLSSSQLGRTAAAMAELDAGV